MYIYILTSDPHLAGEEKPHMVNQSIGIWYSATPEFRFLVEVLCTHILLKANNLYKNIPS